MFFILKVRLGLLEVPSGFQILFQFLPFLIFYLNRAKTVQLSADKIVSLQKAIEEGAIPAEVGDHLRRVDKLTFAEAVGKGLIDVAQDRYTCSETGKQMTIAEAVSQGLIDTGTVKSGDEPGEKTNLARVIASDEFEERSGRVQVRKFKEIPIFKYF